MSLFETIKKDRIAAIKNKEEVKKNLLGVLQGDCSKNDKNPSDEIVIATIKSFLKNNAKLQSDCEKFENTVAIAEAEVEAEILNSYLPKQLSEEATIAGIKFAINLGSNNIGSIQKYFKENYLGRFDGAMVSKLAKEILNG